MSLPAGVKARVVLAAAIAYDRFCTAMESRLARVLTAFSLVALGVVVVRLRAAAQAAPVCSLQNHAGGLLDHTLNQFQGVAAPLMTAGIEQAETIFVAYGAFRVALSVLELLPQLRQEGYMALVRLGPILWPMALGLAFIVGFDVMFTGMKTWAATWVNAPLNTVGIVNGDGSVSPSSIFGTFDCLGALVLQGAKSGGFLAAIETFIPAEISSTLLVVTGGLIAASMLFFLCEAAIAVPVGAPTLGGLAGAEGKNMAMTYLGSVIGVLAKIATSGVVVAVCQLLVQGWEDQLAHPDMMLYNDMISASVIAAILAWFLPIVAQRYAGAPGAATVMAIVGIGQQAHGNLQSLRQMGRQGGGGGGRGGGGKNGSTQSGNSRDGSSRETSSSNGSQNNGKAEVFGREMP